MKKGFTLIELSIVLVIIGLITGAILAGQDMINAATIRAEISQIEKYQTAVNTFKGKYGGLPGDLPDPIASQYGFQARGTNPGQGDGNGIIEGVWTGPLAAGDAEDSGETVVFWKDLATANLIADGMANSPAGFIYVGACTGTNPVGCFPVSKLSSTIYTYVWSGGITGTDGTNYYTITAVSGTTTTNGVPYSNSPGLTVSQAYAIDKKMDDGLPQSGNVRAMYVDFGPNWAYSALNPSPMTCFDLTSGAYSTNQNNGTGINCALSFKFQ